MYSTAPIHRVPSYRPFYGIWQSSTTSSRVSPRTAVEHVSPYTPDGGAPSSTILPCARRRRAVEHCDTGCSAAAGRRARQAAWRPQAVEHRQKRGFSGHEPSSTALRRLFRRRAIEPPPLPVLDGWGPSSTTLRRLFQRLGVEHDSQTAFPAPGRQAWLYRDTIQRHAVEHGGRATFPAGRGRARLQVAFYGALQ